MKNYLIRLVSLNIAAFCAIGGPAYVYFSQGLETTTIEVKIPFVEDNTRTWLLNMVPQFCVYCHGAFIYGVLELALAIFEDVINVSPRLIKSRLTNLIEMYERQEVSEIQLHFTFKEITKQMLDYEK